MHTVSHYRLHGAPPYRVAVVHGGPGAPGEAAPVARHLARHGGVIEPLQTRDSVEAQVEELKAVLEQYASPPVILIGHSWGAWLSLLLCASHPQLVKKLILISSGSFDESYLYDMNTTRLQRLSSEERRELQAVNRCLDDEACDGQDKAFRRLGELISKLDSYDPVQAESEALEYRFEQYRRVWPQAMQMRHDGELLRRAKSLQCPVVAIHGDYDAHPADGVRVPLSAVVADFRFILLPRCGHTPWLERQARERFFRLLEEEIAADDLKV